MNSKIQINLIKMYIINQLLVNKSRNQNKQMIKKKKKNYSKSKRRKKKKNKLKMSKNIGINL